MRSKQLFVFVSVVLGLFCLLQVLGYDNILCVTSGCEIYKNITIFGMSMYHFGTALSLVALSLILTRKLNYLHIFMTITIISDILLLLYQSFFWPCINCLFVAVNIFALFILSSTLSNKKNKTFYVIIYIWIGLFSVTSFNAVKEKIHPIPVYGSSESSVKVFFSPSCDSCKDVIDSIVEKNMQSDVALYPINKNYEDIEKIDTLICSLRCGETLTTALGKCFGDIKPNKDISIVEFLKNRLILLSNKMYLSKIGSTTVPVIWNNKIDSKQHNKSEPNVINVFGSKEINGCSIESVVESCE